MDSELAEITVRIRDLSITVRGPASQAAELVGSLARQHSSSTRPSSPAPSDSHYSFVEPEPVRGRRALVLKTILS